MCSHMDKDKSFRLRINAEDLERWRREARGKPLAEWIRGKCNRGDIADVDALLQGSEVIEEPTGKVYVPAAVKRVEKCRHGKQKGELCYRCDAKWGYPVIR